MNQWFRSRTNLDDIKDVIKECARPANCTGTKLVKINTEIYSQMTKKNKDQDKPIHWVLTTLSKAVGPLV